MAELDAVLDKDGRRWYLADPVDAEVERLTEVYREEQAESLRQAEIARDALAQVERLTAELADARSGLRYTRQYRALPLPAEGGDE
jgi:hypothetical protein